MNCRVRTLQRISYTMLSMCITKGCCLGSHQLPYMNTLRLEPGRPLNVSVLSILIELLKLQITHILVMVVSPWVQKEMILDN